MNQNSFYSSSLKNHENNLEQLSNSQFAPGNGIGNIPSKSMHLGF